MGDTERQAIDQPEAPSRKELWRLWSATLLPPIAWLFQLQILYILATSFCENTGRGAFVVTTLGALALTALGAFLSHRTRDRVPRDEERDIERERTRFFIRGGLANAAFFGALIIATAIPVFMLRLCL